MDKEPRYRATNLEGVMARQGRRGVWLADELKVSRSLISHVMKGRRHLKAVDAEKIASLLGVDVSDLFVLSDEGNQGSMERAA